MNFKFSAGDKVIAYDGKIGFVDRCTYDYACMTTDDGDYLAYLLEELFPHSALVKVLI